MNQAVQSQHDEASGADLIQVGYAVTTETAGRRAFIALSFEVKACVLAQIASKFNIDARIDGDQKKVYVAIMNAPENVVEQITSILASNGQAIIACDALAPDRWTAVVAEEHALALVTH